MSKEGIQAPRSCGMCPPGFAATWHISPLQERAIGLFPSSLQTSHFCFSKTDDFKWGHV